MKNQNQNVVVGVSRLAEEALGGPSLTDQQRLVSEEVDRTIERFRALGQDMILLKVSSRSDWENKTGMTQGCLIGEGGWIIYQSMRDITKITTDPIVVATAFAALAK